MEIKIDGKNLLALWKANGSVIDAEITAGHVWMSFSGQVRQFSPIELVLGHPDGELSISLFYAGGQIVEPQNGNEQSDFWKKYCRVVQITTDGGAVCTLHERRD